MYNNCYVNKKYEKMLKKIYVLFTIVICCFCISACKDKDTTIQEQEILKVGSSIL